MAKDLEGTGLYRWASRRAMTFALPLAALLLAPSVASAHPGHADGGSILAGFAHPFGGIDHLVAMIAVGLFAARLGGRSLWLIPATFVAIMALGGIAAVAGAALPFAEIAIALSVLAFGFAILSSASPPVLAAMTLVGAFAVFHGYAHGSEMPADSIGLLYGAGFMIATALLHAFGIALGLSLRWFDDAVRHRAMQACGGTIGLIGAALTIGLL